MDATTLAIIGAGPFGLAQAAWAAHAGVDYVAIGRPMDFWTEHMPAGMLLRSGADWHLDPAGDFTIERFFAEHGTDVASNTPLGRDRYLEYAAWLQARRNIRPLDARVVALDPPMVPGDRFHIRFADRPPLAARHVVVAIGFGYFAHEPQDLVARLPRGRWRHSRDAVALDGYAGRRVLIVGGRQSAFEWAALLHEAGAAAVDVVYRHASPAFAESEWEWIDPLVARFAEDPSWFRRLGADQQQALTYRLWSEGRLKIEPWLEGRLRGSSVTLRPQTEVTGGAERAGAVDVGLSTGDTLIVDDVILATGYKVDVARVPFLGGDIARGLVVSKGCPALDEHLQTSIPGLFMTSMAATQDFGPFFGFTVAARVSATHIGKVIRRT